MPRVTVCCECGEVTDGPTIHNTDLKSGRTYCNECWKDEHSCINCGEEFEDEFDGHFVPPSLGEAGFFMCAKK